MCVLHHHGFVVLPLPFLYLRFLSVVCVIVNMCTGDSRLLAGTGKAVL